jgi:hypothetical protein
MPRRVFRSAAGCAAVFLPALWMGVAPGCGERGDRTAPQQSGQLAPPDQVYTVRGIIRDLPDPSRPASAFQVRHVAIDDFVAADGRVVGMDAMVMPFTPARELSLEGFQVGDVVELVFEVRWKTPPRSRVVEIRKLPEDTPLEFRQAQPPAPADSGS